jgi:DNA primase small subunit
LRILREHFKSDVLIDQDPWQTDEKAAELLKLLPDPKLNASLQKKWDAAPGRSSVNKWADIDSLASTGASDTLDAKALRDAKQDILLEYTYPRLDAEVSKKLNHLLKSPFCVHPGTGRVCVPIDVRNVEQFNPLEAPNVIELLSELENWDAEHKNPDDSQATKKIPDWEKTSLKPYVEYFRGFVATLLRDEKAVKREREDTDAMEF